MTSTSTEVIIENSKVDKIIHKKIENLERAMFITAAYNIFRQNLGYTGFVELTKKGYNKDINSLAELYLLAGINMENKLKKAKYFYRACFFNEDIQMKKTMHLTEFSINETKKIEGIKVNVKSTFDLELVIEDKDFKTYKKILAYSKNKLRENRQILMGLYNVEAYNRKLNK